MSHSIVIRGARQNNLRNLDLELPTNELIVVTGVSGSGKSSLVFDTLYAEGQRRYVETFSPYARQFLDRMDQPQVDRIEGIPPAIAIDQTNPVRTSRSTVGTMTELNDHLKLLYSRAAHLHCRHCARAGAAGHRAEHLRGLIERLARPASSGRATRRDVPRAGAAQFHRAGSAGAAGEAGLHARVQALAERERGARPIPRRKGSEEARPSRVATSVVLEMIQDRLRFDADERERLHRSARSGTARRARSCERARARGRTARARATRARAPRRDRCSAGASRPICIAPTATSTIRIRRRACSRSTRRSAPAKRAAASAASSASTSG